MDRNAMEMTERNPRPNETTSPHSITLPLPTKQITKLAVLGAVALLVGSGSVFGFKTDFSAILNSGGITKPETTQQQHIEQQNSQPNNVRPQDRPWSPDSSYDSNRNGNPSYDNQENFLQEYQNGQHPRDISKGNRKSNYQTNFPDPSEITPQRLPTESLQDYIKRLYDNYSGHLQHDPNGQHPREISKGNLKSNYHTNFPDPSEIIPQRLPTESLQDYIKRLQDDHSEHLQYDPNGQHPREISKGNLKSNYHTNFPDPSEIIPQRLPTESLQDYIKRLQDDHSEHLQYDPNGQHPREISKGNLKSNYHTNFPDPSEIIPQRLPTESLQDYIKRLQDDHSEHLQYDPNGQHPREISKGNLKSNYHTNFPAPSEIIPQRLPTESLQDYIKRLQNDHSGHLQNDPNGQHPREISKGNLKSNYHTNFPDPSEIIPQRLPTESLQDYIKRLQDDHSRHLQYDPNGQHPRDISKGNQKSNYQTNFPYPSEIIPQRLPTESLQDYIKRLQDDHSGHLQYDPNGQHPRDISKGNRKPNYQTKFPDPSEFTSSQPGPNLQSR